jgi:putative ABC transport system ATP-binding protein
VTAGLAIEVDSLVVEHATDAGAVRALAGVSFAVAAGSSVAVVGPSGCGKSTLLGVLGGLDTPTSGLVRIAGADISSMTDRQRARFRRAHVGMVYQADNLLPFLTVAENVLLQLALHHSVNGNRERSNAHSDAREATEDLLSALGLSDKTNQLPDQLSGGQRQRVAVARAIVHHPDLILADEPTGALDSANARVVVDLLLAAQQKLGATLVMVTHDWWSAQRLGRQIEMLDGAIAGDSDHRRRGKHERPDP